MKSVYRNYFDVVLLPPKEVNDYVVGVSRSWKKYGTKWNLGRNSYLPHVSLYHIAVKPKNFNKFISELKRVVKPEDLGHLKITEFEDRLLMTDRPQWVQKLYKKVIKSTVQYYDWNYGPDELWNIGKFPKWMQKTGSGYMKKYGSPLMGANFRPHFTLTRFNSGQPKLSKSDLRLKKMQFRPRGVFVCELGESHTCQRVVARIV